MLTYKTSVKFESAYSSLKVDQGKTGKVMAKKYFCRTAGFRKVSHFAWVLVRKEDEGYLAFD